MSVRMSFTTALHGCQFDAEGREAIGRKILQAHRHQHIRAAGDGGGEDVAVIGIGEVDGFNQVIVARDQAPSRARP